jgi:curved DNA-binding protein
MEYKDYYKILGVNKSATDKELKQAYRKLARKYHPDVTTGDKKAAEARFKEINEAYEVLGDPEKRKRYDTLGANWQQYEQWQRAGGGAREQPFDWSQFGFGGAPSGQQRGYRTVTPEEAEELFGGEFSDFFRTFFGGMGFGGATGGRARARRGQDYEQPVEVTLEEAFTGTQRLLGMTTAAGQERRLEVKIPPGVQSGSRIRMAGQGGPGLGGGPSGDLYLVVTVRPHATYERKGDDLHLELPVPLTTLMLGGEVAVPTLRGTRLALKIPPETQNGKTFSLRGQGMPRLQDPNKRGDLYVKVRAVLPTNLTVQEKALFEELRQTRG